MHVDDVTDEPLWQILKEAAEKKTQALSITLHDNITIQLQLAHSQAKEYYGMVK